MGFSELTAPELHDSTLSLNLASDSGKHTIQIRSVYNSNIFGGRHNVLLREFE